MNGTAATRTSARLASIAVAALVGVGCAATTTTEPATRRSAEQDGAHSGAPTDAAASSPTSDVTARPSDPPPTADGGQGRDAGAAPETAEPPAEPVTIVPFPEHPYDEVNRGVEWRFSLRVLADDRYEYAFYNTEFPGFVVRRVLEARPEAVYDLGDPECPWSEPVVFVPLDASATGSARTSCVTRRGRAIVRQQTVEIVSATADAIRYRISSEEHTEWSDGPQTTSTIDDYVFDRSLGWHDAWRSTIRRDDDDGISGPYEYRYVRRTQAGN